MRFEDAALKFIPNVPLTLYPLIKERVWVEGSTEDEARTLLDRNSEKWHAMYRAMEEEKQDAMRRLSKEYNEKLDALDSPNAEYELIGIERASKEFGTRVDKKLWHAAARDLANHKAGHEIAYISSGPNLSLWRCLARDLASRSAQLDAAQG